ncbi:MAG: hypothetical protein WBG41_16560 [Acidimicrobiales bacterium]
MHPDITTRLPLQLGDELWKAAVDDCGVRPGLSGCRRHRHELLDTIDEAGEWLDVTGRPETSPLLVGPVAEEHGVLGGDNATEVLLHRLIPVGDELGWLLYHAVERQQLVGNYLAHGIISLFWVRLEGNDVRPSQNSSPPIDDQGRRIK